jgi:hypothetical protein
VGGLADAKAGRRFKRQYRSSTRRHAQAELVEGGLGRWHRTGTAMLLFGVGGRGHAKGAEGTSLSLNDRPYGNRHCRYERMARKP